MASQKNAWPFKQNNGSGMVQGKEIYKNRTSTAKRESKAFANVRQISASEHAVNLYTAQECTNSAAKCQRSKCNCMHKPKRLKSNHEAEEPVEPDRVGVASPQK